MSLKEEIPSTVGIIPVRYHSTRLPGKPLADICGMTLIERVYRQCMKASVFSRVIIATDSSKIAKHAHRFGAEVVMTAADHSSGTDRVAEAAAELELTGLRADFVVNVQGDMPFIRPSVIDSTAHRAIQYSREKGIPAIGTAAAPITDALVMRQPDAVKVVFDREQRALYFSRSDIPSHRREPEGPVGYHHLGIYAFHREALRTFSELPAGDLERAERLEQLRALEAGIPIVLSIIDPRDFSSAAEVNNPEDLERANSLAAETHE